MNKKTNTEMKKETTVIAKKSNLDDLPEELKKELRLPRIKENLESKIQEIFEKDNSAKDVNDIILQLFANTKTVYKRQSVLMSCMKLIKSGFLKRENQGVYFS